MGAFGTVLPVTGLNNGYLGQVSRLGERVVASRPVLATTATQINFGDPVVIVPAASQLGDSYQSVADFIAGGGTFTAARFAGVAFREVKTNVQFTTLFNTNNVTINSYQPNELAEALERGSICVKINAGLVPLSQGPVYVRIAVDAGVPTGVIGGFEGAASPIVGSSLLIPNVVFRTGYVDGNGVAEITLLNRVAA